MLGSNSALELSCVSVRAPPAMMSRRTVSPPWHACCSSSFTVRGSSLLHMLHSATPLQRRHLHRRQCKSQQHSAAPGARHMARPNSHGCMLRRRSSSSQARTSLSPRQHSQRRKAPLRRSLTSPSRLYLFTRRRLVSSTTSFARARLEAAAEAAAAAEKVGGVGRCYRCLDADTSGSLARHCAGHWPFAP